jgi:hypothetical protein
VSAQRCGRHQGGNLRSLNDICLSLPNFQTNTYQAILSTDGSRSYALFLYQNSGMRWDVTQEPYNRVLMGFSR